MGAGRLVTPVVEDLLCRRRSRSLVHIDALTADAGGEDCLDVGYTGQLPIVGQFRYVLDNFFQYGEFQAPIIDLLHKVANSIKIFHATRS